MVFRSISCLPGNHRWELPRTHPIGSPLFKGARPHLTSVRPRPFVIAMEIPEDEPAFLRELVKASRQKVHHVKWIDRDGTERVTSLTQAEAVRLNTIAHRLKVSKSEVLRQAAHVPVVRQA